MGAIQSTLLHVFNSIIDVVFADSQYPRLYFLSQMNMNKSSTKRMAKTIILNYSRNSVSMQMAQIST